jgi:hypothetical protein
VIQEWNDDQHSIRGLEHQLHVSIYRAGMLKQLHYTKCIVTTHRLHMQQCQQLRQFSKAKAMEVSATIVRKAAASLSRTDRIHALRMGKADAAALD